MMNQDACWVWTKNVKINQYVQFIQHFTYRKDPACKEDIYFHVSADSQYVAWLNGKLLAFGQYADFPDYKVYDTVKVDESLLQSENTLCILGYYQGADSQTYVTGRAGVLFDIVGNKTLAMSGADTIAREAPDFFSGPMEKITSQLSFSFSYNACGYDGWNRSEYKPSNEWQPACVMENTAALFERPVSKLKLEGRTPALIQSQGCLMDDCGKESTPAQHMQYNFMAYRDLPSLCGLTAPQSLPSGDGIKLKSSDGDGMYLIVDIGSEETGLINIDIDVPESTRIDIGFGEHLDDMRVRTFISGRNFAARYISRGGRQTFTNYVRRIGCRYLQLDIYSHEAVIYYAGLLPTHYPVKEKGRFACSDLLHQKIYETSVRTLLLCMHEHYEDCPWREQALYSMDSRNQILCGYYCFGEYEFARESIRLLGKTLRKDGLLELCAPSGVDITIPSFTLMWVVELYEYVLYSGDREFGREMLETAGKIISAFESRIESDGVLSCFCGHGYWNFYEWQTGLDGEEKMSRNGLSKSYDAPLNAYFSLAMNAFSKLCSLTGYTELAGRYEQFRNNFNKKIDLIFWSQTENAYLTYANGGFKDHFCELTQSLMVCCGACSGEKKDIVLRKLSDNKSGLIAITLNDCIFKYEALLTEKQKYARYVFGNIAEVWGKMLFCGATSFWETQRGAWDFCNAGSLCHGWSAVPVYFYYAYILGVKPETPGMEKVAFSPVNSDILSANGHVPGADGGYDIHVAADNSGCEKTES